MANRASHTITNDSYSNASTRSAYNFSDELLLALERSGKTLVQIQAVILPWGNEESEDAITVNGKEYCNDDKTLSNSVQKRARVRELLEATLNAKEQAHNAVQDLEQKYELLTENMKATGERFRYLADVAKRLFGVTISDKRKLPSETPLRYKLSPGFYGCRMKSRCFNYSGVGKEEKSPRKKIINLEVVTEDGMEAGEITRHRLKKSTKASFPPTCNTPTSTLGPQLEPESFGISTGVPKRREPPVESYISPSLKLDEKIPQIKHRGNKSIAFIYKKSSSTAIDPLPNEDGLGDQTLGRYCYISNTSGDSFRRMRMKPGFPVLRIPKTAADGTWEGRCSKTYPAKGALNGKDFLASSSETAHVLRSTNDGSQSSNLLSSGPESLLSKTAFKGRTQIQRNNMGMEDWSWATMDTNNTEANRVALREHKRQTEQDYQDENYEIPHRRVTSDYIYAQKTTEEESDTALRSNNIGGNSYPSDWQYRLNLSRPAM